MKKILFAVALLAAFTANSFAGVTLGLTLSGQSESMTGDESKYFSDETVSSAEAFGLGVLVPFNPMLSLHTGLSFQFNLYSYTVGDDYGYSEDLDQMNVFLNLQLPLLARVNLTPGFFLEAGAEMQLNLLAQHYNEAGKDNDFVDEWNEIEDWSAFQLSPSFGLGYTLWFGLEFSGRFSYGVLAAYDEGDANWHPLRFQLDISYWFGYKK